MALIIGGMAALSAGTVLFVSTYANIQNTTELLNTSAEMIIDTIEENVIDLTAPIEKLAKALKKGAETGDIDLANIEFLNAYFAGVSATVPYLTDLGVVYPDGSYLFITQTFSPDGPVFTPTVEPPTAGAVHYIQEVKNKESFFWNEPFFNDGRTHISVAVSIQKGGDYLGTVIVSSTVHHFSEVVGELNAKYGVTGFILYGDDHVLAHPKILELAPTDLSSASPLHSVSTLGDPVIAQMLNVSPEFHGRDDTFDGFVVETEQGEQLILTSTMESFGSVPWVVGQYSPLSDWSGQWSRLSDSVLVGLGLVAVSVLAALLLAKRVAAPIRRSTEGAMEISQLNLDQIGNLPPSRVSELNQQAIAFNRMLVGLRWFETYLPRALVRQLVKTGNTAIVQPREVELTVMFADIQGFTASSETMSPKDTAEMLNRHFEILNRCIEQEGGTLDKYIGDAVLAFWGAPEEQADHAERACRAALAIRRSLSNAGIDYGVKIALHTGPLIVGNIGAVDRINYTVIGDTVNTCARIEALAGSLPSDELTRIMVSEATAGLLGRSFDLTHVGDFQVKGRSGPVTVYQL
ncbi:adenylate cyclase [Ruegeria halocynthiae]|uniref:Adenylate cyclase n=1 Tax=Ruegeria halocynthiae TaxID=985054 RepID=A0A1H3E0E7_9RHOB|nr:adenylate cyclase [Ruegeria halocynthiae]